ncbi:hypothetical protein TNCV_631541 [Trichonephila clavipes]|nr:hypothetical protein TNCV_631541 [Trichonephila clavipes]
MGKRRTDLSGSLQCLNNGKNNVSEIEFVSVLSSIKCLKLIVDQIDRRDASNPIVFLAAHATGSSISNELTLETDSHSDSITELT